MKLFTQNNSLAARDKDIWFEAGNAPMSTDTQHAVVVFPEVFQRAIVFEVKEGTYYNHVASAGTRNNTTICYARFDSKKGLIFTALDKDLLSDFSRSLVSYPESNITTSEANDYVRNRIFKAPDHLEPSSPTYLLEAFAVLLEKENADQSTINWLKDKIKSFNPKSSADEQKKYVSDLQNEAVKNEHLQAFFAGNFSLPWSLGVRIETNMQPLYDYYQQLMTSDKSDEEKNALKSKLLFLLGDSLALKKIIKGKLQDKLEYFRGDVGKSPFDFKEISGKPTLRLSLLKITEKFANGYVQVAKDLLGIDEGVAVHTPEIIRRRNLNAIETILSWWEQFVSRQLLNAGGHIEEKTAFIISAFNLSVDKRQVIESVINSHTHLLNPRTGEINLDALNNLSFDEAVNDFNKIIDPQNSIPRLSTT